MTDPEKGTERDPKHLDDRVSILLVSFKFWENLNNMNLPFLSISFIGTKCTHNAVKPSPPSILITFSSS